MLVKLAWCQAQIKYNLWLLNNQVDHFVSDILYSLVKLTGELVFSYTGNVRKCYFFFFCRILSLVYYFMAIYLEKPDLFLGFYSSNFLKYDWEIVSSAMGFVFSSI